VRFLLIDRITAWEPGVRGRAVKCVALSEDFFEDHFPSQPILPGALLLEGMAQLAGVLLEEGVKVRDGRVAKALLSIVEKAKFRRPVRPGDCIEFEARVISANDAGGKVEVTAAAAGTAVAEAALVFTFHEFSDEHLEARRTRTLSLWLEGVEGAG